jgi:succinate dehydrogenase/fumarate reductase flavoprotein subunit
MATLSRITRWDDEADVVILGFGLAGAVAAIEAHDTDADADVLIVEKMPEAHAGGNSRVSGQTLVFPTDAEAWVRYQRVLNEPNPVPDDLLHAVAAERVGQEEWVAAMAAEVGMELVVEGHYAAEYPDVEGSECIRERCTLRPAEPGAPKGPGEKGWSAAIYPSATWLTFKAHVDRRPIRVRYESRAFDLVQDSDTLEVFGVLARQGDSVIAIKARRALVMCTGGYEANIEMQRNYGGYERVYPFGTPANTGDGIKMLQKAGAELWHLRNRNESAGNPPGIKTPEYTAPFKRNPRITAWSWIDIAKDNKRYHDESEDSSQNHYRVKKNGHWSSGPLPFVMPVHMIFDEATRAQTSIADTFTLANWSIVIEGYRWSPDNSAEIDRGWITRADSIRDLATQLDRDPDEVEATVNRYNDACAAGVDGEYGRQASFLSPIGEPPFYAVGIVPGLICTTGGGKRNARSQVIDQDGNVIPRLYEAGELGSMMSNLYQAGSFLTEAMLSGRWAGKNAVNEDPWEEIATSPDGQEQLQRI